jgi:hypothetical protein
VLVAARSAAASPTRVSSSTPYPGIVHEEWADASIPAVLHVVKVDLTSSEIQLVATAAADRGHTTSAAAQTLGAVVAVNGDYFAVAGFQPAGLAMGGGTVWPGTADDAKSGFFAFARTGERTFGTISPPPDVVATSAIDAATQGIVGGRPLLVAGGTVSATFDCTDADAQPCVRGPRTAVALSADGNAMWLVVVDGWQSASAGMTAAELAAFAVQLGASDALAFDGGSASSMVLGGAEIASPSDGVERAVANHLGVRYGSLPKATLVGFIRAKDVFNGTDLPGSVATLDDGRQQTTGANAMYDFANVTPRYACVTASYPGYHTATRCVQVQEGMINYDSIPLFPNSDFIDANPGAPDASPFPDARVVDAQPGGDGGNPIGGDGTGAPARGCCSAGGSTFAGADPALALGVLVVVRWRRRRTTRGR